MKTIVHVNQHVIAANARSGARDAVLTVKTYKENRYAHAVRVRGPSRLVYSPNKPLSCGARVWLETQAEVELFVGATPASAYLPETLIVVNKLVIRGNIGADKPAPVLDIHRGKSLVQAFAARIAGPCWVAYCPNAPLHGAQVWVATDSSVTPLLAWERLSLAQEEAPTCVAGRG